MAELREFQFTNFARSTLSSDLAAGATTLNIQPNQSHLFPNAEATYDEIFACILLTPDETEIEIVYCTARASGLLIVERGKEFTADRDWPAGTTIVHNYTAQLGTDIVEGGSRVNGMMFVGWDGNGMITKDGVNFERLAFFGFDHDFDAVAYSKPLDRMVACGSLKSIVYSDDGGYTWFEQPDVFTEGGHISGFQHTDIIWSDQFQLFICCSNNSNASQSLAVQWSEDGLTWTEFDTSGICTQSSGKGFASLVDVPAPFSKPGIYAMHWKSFAYSADGKTWVDIPDQVDLGWGLTFYGGASFANGTILFGGSSQSSSIAGPIVYSNDGITFTEVDGSLGDNSDTVPAAYMTELGRFVATTNTSVVPATWASYSDDNGLSWIGVDNVEVGQGRWSRPIYSNKFGVVFILSQQINTPDTMLMKSSDAISWVFQPIPAEFGTNIWWKGAAEATVPVVRFKQEVIMVEDTGGSTNVAFSADAATFDQLPAAQNAAIRDVEFCPTLGTQGRFVLVGTVGIINTSDDAGQTWTVRTSPDVLAVYRTVIWSASLELFIAGADNTGTQNIATSPDGIDWTLRTTPQFRVYDIADDGNGNLVAVGEGALLDAMYSPDGINWTLATGDAGDSGSGSIIVQFDVARNRFVLIDSDEEVWVSTDLGANWTDLVSDLETVGGNMNKTNGAHFIILSSGRFIATTSTSILSSDDGGQTWTIRSTEGSQRGLVQLGNGHVVSCAQITNRQILHSFDNGTTWLIGSDPLGAAAGVWHRMAVGNVTEIP
jgi:photosystem II stability/assembly factor-like uncharacterized protein